MALRHFNSKRMSNLGIVITNIKLLAAYILTGIYCTFVIYSSRFQKNSGTKGFGVNTFF